MNKKPESGMDRLKKIALWQWGLIVVMAGVMSNLLMRMQPPSGNAAAQRAVVLGRGVATLLFLVVGLVLIVLHFVRRNRR
jgi:hypothetical protein